MSRFWTFLAQMQAPGGQPGLQPQPLPHPELPDPATLTFGPPWWHYALAGIVVFSLLALVLWLLFRPRRAVAPPVRRPWNKALASLRDLKERVGSQPPVETVHQVSEILRHYFLERYHIPAPFRTTRELFEREIPAASKAVQRYEPLARMWDELSFAPVPTSPSEATALVERAIGYLEEDRP